MRVKKQKKAMLSILSMPMADSDSVFNLNACPYPESSVSDLDTAFRLNTNPSPDP
jgi:hypothetical protein